MKISELKESDRLKALDYQKLYPNIGSELGLDSINSFIWRKTKEGEDYWRNLHKAIFIDKYKPTHYQNKSNYDVIDFCNDYKLNFNRGSAVKYIARAGKKEDEIKELKKAIDFLEREIKFLENE